VCLLTAWPNTRFSSFGLGNLKSKIEVVINTKMPFDVVVHLSVHAEKPCRYQMAQ
jgi:hypothetical protein